MPGCLHTRSVAFLFGLGPLASMLALALGCSPPAGPDGYIETGDLPELRKRGELRILMPPRQIDGIPRRAYSLDEEREMAGRLARSLGLDPVVVTVGDRGRLVEDLLEGRGDLLVARLTVTPERRERLAFSIPIDSVREVLVTRADDDSVTQPADLAGKRVAVRASSSYFETLTALLERIPDLEITTVDETLDTEEILHLVSQGVYDATVADDDIFEKVQTYVANLHAPFALTGTRSVAWAMRPRNPRLKGIVDGFIDSQALTRHLDGIAVGDLHKIRERGILRVLTLNGSASYFLYRGEEMGFEFELARRFAEEIGCRLQVVVPPRADLLVPWLLGGRGDLVAASMTVTEERRRRVRFTRPYNWIGQVVVARSHDPISERAGLLGREVAVRPSSAYFDTLNAIQPEIEFAILAAPEELATENIIARVASGEYDLTVSDSNILEIELTYRDDVREAFHLGEPASIAWMIRPDDEHLLTAADAFLSREYRGTFYNVIKKRYFENKRVLATMATDRLSVGGAISPWDDLFRKYGKQVEIDWRLLVAQAYQESRFDPEATSWAGAVGLMQVLPRTAAGLDEASDLRDPQTGIRVGARYLKWLFDHFEPTLDRGPRLRFALAAYNAGRGHVQDGRRIARSMGLDPDRWFGHVERALPLLSEPEYARQARFGYCRCREPVEYVRGVTARYQAYVQAGE
jgi:membrane-bound lytic murein transglycosylase F